MKKKFSKIILRLFIFTFAISSSLIIVPTEVSSATDINPSVFIKKVSKSYTNKFCNAVGFGLSKESAMNFSLEENKQVFKKKKEFNTLNKELLAEEIAISVVEKCGYPINLNGEEGINEFKNYYLSEDKDQIEVMND